LRTPLTSIKGFVDLLLEGEAGPLSDEQQEFLDIVRHSTDHLGAIIDQLLDVSRIESGRIELERSAVDLAAILVESTDAVRPGIAAKDQALALDLPGELPAVWGNAERVKQIVANLLSNAHRYTPRGGSITVVAPAQPDQGPVSARGPGIGLSADEQAQLFSRFFRARNRATQEAGGTGLGLVITRALVELHGGVITVESAPGGGSTFSFTLPTAESAPVAASPATAAPAG